jgi:hypothetical protein
MDILQILFWILIILLIIVLAPLIAAIIAILVIAWLIFFPLWLLFASIATLLSWFGSLFNIDSVLGITFSPAAIIAIIIAIGIWIALSLEPPSVGGG